MEQLVDSSYREYDYIDSFARIDEILSTPQGNFQEVNSLPDRDKLTYSNGFYANCSAIFMDIRESSELPNHYKRPALAKLYRAFISEAVAILNSESGCRELNIVGDCVWAVINTPFKSDIDDVYSLTAMLNSLMKVLNYKLRKASYLHPIRAGIGAAWGRALMVQAGYRGTGINDVVYMGDVVNRASKLAAMANVRQTPKYQQPYWYKGLSTETYSPPIYLSNNFVGNLKADNTKWITKDQVNDCYTADVVNTQMNDWYNENCN